MKTQTVMAPSLNYDMLAVDRAVFLAGSIEMGTAENWQTRAIQLLDGKVKFIFNPRRDDWDSSWVQSIDNPQFSEQVNWELDHLNKSTGILFYFDPATKSPITLLELGLMVSRLKHIVVVCPEGYWRKGNVDIVCQRQGIRVFTELEPAVQTLLTNMEV